ncbi:20903_t:CDS:2, partial [Racocetra persica]
AGTLLQKAIQENSKEKAAEVQELLRLRAFVLRVAEEEGWNIAAKISKPIPSEGDEFKELLVKARKQVKLYEGRSMSYSRRSWKSKRTESWAPGPERNHYAPYSLLQPYAQYPPAIQEYQNPNMIQNPGPAYQNLFNKLMTKQITCYFCGSAGHTASVCPSKKQTDGNNKYYRQKQGGGCENPRARGRKLLDKGNKPTTCSNLLVKKPRTSIPEKCVDSGQKREPETLQINLGTKAVFKEGDISIRNARSHRKSSYSIASPGFLVGSIRRTFEKPGVGVFGGAHPSIKELLQLAKKLARDSVSPFYKARSDRYWGLYKKFCKRFDLDVESPREEGILAFIIWLDMMGLAPQTPRIIQVVVNSLRFEAKENFRKNLAVTQVLRAIKKETSKYKTPDWPCDPLPIEALRHYVDVPPSWADDLMYKRDIALVALGLRTMRRLGEIGDLKLKDIKWDNKAILWVRICKSKMDQFRNGRNGWGITIVLIKTGQKSLGLSCRPDSKWFSEHVGLNSRFTAHSLRIEEATAAMTVGISLTQIRAIGGWDSKAVMLYLRTVSTAKAGISRGM